MNKSAEKAAELLKILSNSKRLMIVCHLAEGEKSVNELAEMLGMRASTVSQHLQILRLSKLVETRRNAQTIFYSLTHAASEDVIMALYKNFCIAPNLNKSTKAKTETNSKPPQKRR
ncbi:MAG: metalloregulator ArsR/SmtB family transcription factor [Pseudobdellovibrionaceae bacterium]|nr:metalloregulator ArsR/SmtB family transcription factor [Pseudobdellovibrionaceae bacterium]